MIGIIDPVGYEKVNRVYSPSGDCPTITARDYKDPIKVIVVGRMDNTIDHTFESANRIYSSQGLSPTIPVCASDKTPKVLVDMNKNDNIIANGTARHGTCRIIGQMDNTVDHTFESANRVYDSMGCAPTIPTCAGGNIQPKVLVKK